ncbi:MAG: hypothetical protein BWK73_04650 [Thiothrix lacustris]|uniref:Phage tail collar domain-containing protein n=1 Tax=Thiothrix lacustris TaxID=525917 RepID=A0A1Y1QXH9_9GAMM|nr:MAG: hypothetical protein BWK73_04650 [Thiothrix lacustris]
MTERLSNLKINPTTRDALAARVAAGDGHPDADFFGLLNEYGRKVLLVGKGAEAAPEEFLPREANDALYVKLSQIGEQATDEEVAEAVSQHVQSPHPHPQYAITLAASAPLPTTNIGVIFHESYNSIMTWRDINNYTGYASVNLGTIVYAQTNLSIPGYLPVNGVVLPAHYAALIALVGPSLVDLRGEFIRVHDGGRGVDSGRLFGSYQSDEYRSHYHQCATWNGLAGGYESAYTSGGFDYGAGAPPTTSSGGGETRPRNIALGAYIKF